MVVITDSDKKIHELGFSPSHGVKTPAKFGVSNYSMTDRSRERLNVNGGNFRKRRFSDIGPVRATNTPFKRVEEEKIVFKDERLRDNSFYSKGDTYGVKAYQDLSVTRGKGFRKAMTKKKRQSHHGGTLDPNNVSSYKFSDDSD